MASTKSPVRPMDSVSVATCEGLKPLVSVVVPAYNEARSVERNLGALCRYLETLQGEYRWELIVVNDGSTDDTGRLADEFARTHANVHVLHHLVNFGLGQALRFGFGHCRGDYVVTMDFDLSYSPDHIGALLARIRGSGAKVVVTSPYMKGGQISNVPWLRRTMSVWANRFLSLASNHSVSTLTGMVRAYDGAFLRSLSLRSMYMEINPEVLYKAMLLNARIEEIPAHLNWELQRSAGLSRRSSMKMLRQTLKVLLAGFLFRPVMFFILPGTAILIFALYTNTWMFIHFFEQYGRLTSIRGLEDRVTAAVGAAFQQYPYTFLIGLMSLVLAIQLLSLGIVALQNREYFQEMFYLGTQIHRSAKQYLKENEND